jgi:WD40 repeat protein
MLRSIALSALAGTIILGLAGCSGSGGPNQTGQAGSGDGQPGAALYSNAPLRKPERSHAAEGPVDPIVIPDCRLVEWEKQDVPSQRDGKIDFIGTEIQEGENVPPELILTVPMGKEEARYFLYEVQLGGLLAAAPGGPLEVLPLVHLKPERRYRRLQQGDRVTKGQLLGRLDDRLQRDELAIKKHKIIVSRADHEAAEKTRDEAKVRHERNLLLKKTGGAVSLQDLGESRLAYDRYVAEEASKREGIHLAELEKEQADTLVKMHEIRSDIPGTIKEIYKSNGDAVKSQETVMQIRNDNRLRVEGFVEAQNLADLRPGMTAVIEYPREQRPLRTLSGHHEEITAVAVSQDVNHPLIVSASADGLIKVWDRSAQPAEQRTMHHGKSVRALACTPPGASENLCLSGATDGTAYLWDLNQEDPQPRKLEGQHRGAITCVAFSPDGKWCATGGEDREINLWETATGQLRYRFSEKCKDGHRGAVTAVTFTPEGSRLVSAGSDKTIRVWFIGADAPKLEYFLDHRGGYVTQPGVSADGKELLFDQGKVLRVLSIPDQRDLGSLVNPSAAANFTTFALFSPDAKLILTTGAIEGRVQLWRAPAGSGRGYEVRELVAPEHAPATCAAFAPDGSFIVTGAKDHKVFIWPVPEPSDIDQQITTRLSMVEQAVEGSGHQVRIRADLANPPDHHLLPGTTVTLVIEPRKR